MVVIRITCQLTIAENIHCRKYIGVFDLKYLRADFADVFVRSRLRSIEST